MKIQLQDVPDLWDIESFTCVVKILGEEIKIGLARTESYWVCSVIRSGFDCALIPIKTSLANGLLTEFKHKIDGEDVDTEILNYLIELQRFYEFLLEVQKTEAQLEKTLE